MFSHHVLSPAYFINLIPFKFLFFSQTNQLFFIYILKARPVLSFVFTSFAICVISITSHSAIIIFINSTYSMCFTCLEQNNSVIKWIFHAFCVFLLFVLSFFYKSLISFMKVVPDFYILCCYFTIVFFINKFYLISLFHD